ncbi:MAG TPA: gamma-glutamyl-gamma-aminobutyrate hydrolase family protein, partial [Chthoniobacterales bacterium]|nr:gamma-glutamyl-gamma-aminobutyrate hydrolase family protein [Chthoniobacterales bacterium]
WFQPFFDKHPDIAIWNARTQAGDFSDADGLLLSGGADIAVEFLRQDVPDPGLLEKDADPIRDEWEFQAVAQAMERGIPIFAICKGMQLLNVALGGTLKLDIPGHRAAEMKENDVQPLRHDRAAKHRFEKVNSSHHQAVDRLADGFSVEAWCKADDIVEQMRLSGRPFVVGVQYHPERGRIYDALFEDFFSRIRER